MVQFFKLMRHYWHILTLNFAPYEAKLSSWGEAMGLGMLHLVGMGLLIRLSHQGWWIFLPVGWFLLPFLFNLKTKSATFYWRTTSPMLLLYAMLGLRILIAIFFKINEPSSNGLTIPQSWAPYLGIPTYALLSLAWVWATQLYLASQFSNRPFTWRKTFFLLSAGLLIFSFVWATITYIDVRAKGATASDPYAYLQMADDFAEQGTLEHQFELTALTHEANLPLYPLVPIGYRVPETHHGKSATVWPPGYAVILGLMNIVGGEQAMLATTPIFGLLSLGALVLLAWHLLATWESTTRLMAIAVSVFVLATSLLQLLWLGLPMADIPAQFFSVMALFLALKAVRSQTLVMAFLSGICLGLAFAIRYTQLMVGFSIVIVFILSFLFENPNKRLFLQSLLAAGVGAWLVALPVLWYHNTAFGSPFSVGSSELELFDLRWVDDTAWRMFKDLFSKAEFLWLLPLMAWGWVILWRNLRHETIGLLVYIGAIIIFHLPYAALRLRDLLSIFPLLALATGIGSADLLRRVNELPSPTWRPPLRIATVVLLTIVLWVRSGDTLQMTGGSFQNFGYLRQEQRNSFDEIHGLTEENSVIASSLNAGALILYSGRTSVRPYDWDTNQWFAFIELMSAQEKPLYFLRDGVDMESVFENTQSQYKLEQIATLNLPYFYIGGGSIYQVVTLYQILKDA